MDVWARVPRVSQETLASLSVPYLSRKRFAHYARLNTKDLPASCPRQVLNLNLSLRVSHILARGTFNFAPVPRKDNSRHLHKDNFQPLRESRPEAFRGITDVDSHMSLIGGKRIFSRLQIALCKIYLEALRSGSDLYVLQYHFPLIMNLFLLNNSRLTNN